MSRIIWIKIIANKSRHSCQGLYSSSLIQRIITRKSCLHLLISNPNPDACNQYKMKWNDPDNQDIQPGNVPSRFPTSDHKLFCNDSMSSTLGLEMLRKRERKYYGTDKAKQIWQRASFIANISDCVWIVSFCSASEGPSAVSSVAKDDGACIACWDSSILLRRHSATTTREAKVYLPSHSFTWQFCFPLIVVLLETLLPAHLLYEFDCVPISVINFHYSRNSIHTPHMQIKSLQRMDDLLLN